MFGCFSIGHGSDTVLWIGHGDMAFEWCSRMIQRARVLWVQWWSQRKFGRWNWSQVPSRRREQARAVVATVVDTAKDVGALSWKAEAPCGHSVCPDQKCLPRKDRRKLERLAVKGVRRER